MVAVWKSDLVGSDISMAFSGSAPPTVAGALTLSGQIPSDDPNQDSLIRGGKFPDRPI